MKHFHSEFGYPLPNVQTRGSVRHAPAGAAFGATFGAI
jgi:hypothetical protein